MSDDDEPTGWRLALSFDTDEEEFARGVEVGMIWERLDAMLAEEKLEATMQSSNTEMVLRIAEASRRPVRCEPCIVDGREMNEWIYVTFGSVAPRSTEGGE